MSGFKNVRVSNIPALAKCQFLNFQGYKGFTNFRKYDRVLSIHRDTIMEGF